MDFTNQSSKDFTLITGSSSGIGLELAKVFAKNGHNLILVARSLEIKKIAKDLEEKFQIRAIGLSYDLSLTTNIQKMLTEIEDYGFFIQILVNNLGIGDYAKFIQSQQEKQIEIIDTNLKNMLILTKLVLTKMQKANYGKILNVSSLLGYTPSPYMSVYAASKAFILSFSLALRQELTRQNIQVSVLCPGPVETNFFVKNSIPVEPFWLIPASYLAENTYKAFFKNQAVIVPSYKHKLLLFFIKILPKNLLSFIIFTFFSKKVFRV